MSTGFIAISPQDISGSVFEAKFLFHYSKPESTTSLKDATQEVVLTFPKKGYRYKEGPPPRPRCACVAERKELKGPKAAGRPSTAEHTLDNTWRQLTEPSRLALRSSISHLTLTAVADPVDE